jgi:hypothetical protein
VKGLATIAAKYEKDRKGNKEDVDLIVFQAPRRGTLIKKKIKFTSYSRKFRMEQLQSHI